VGTHLVQLAAAAGARDIAAASPTKLHVPRALGAELTVDYTTARWATDVRDATSATPTGDPLPAGPRVVYDGVGGAVGRAALDLVGPGGRFLVFGAASGGMTDTSDPAIAARGITISGLADFHTLGDLTALAADALAEAAAGRLRPTIGQTFPLDRAADAHAAIESRTATGKTLLTVAGR
jgi:NADPH2:quinone reductase